MRLARASLAFVTVTALAACGKDSTGAVSSDRSGSVSFTYGGPASGTFSASGAVSFASAFVPRFGTWAFGLRGTANGEPLVSVSALAAKASPMGDYVALSVIGLASPGTVPFSTACATASCAFGVFRPDARFQPDSIFDMFATTTFDFWFTSGTVTIFSIDSRRVRGALSGLARHAGDTTQVVTVTAGTFDVPLVTPILAGAAGATMP